MDINDLYTLTLADGLPVEMDGKTIRYRQVRLRETTVADERAAIRLAERAVMVAGQWKLIVSDADFRFALTMRHVDAFICDNQRIGQQLIDLELFGKLSSHDLGLIEQRVFLLTLAAELRYGNITQDQFDAIAAGKPPLQANAAPQPVGQASDAGTPVGGAEPGPALLADFVGRPAAGPADGAGS